MSIHCANRVWTCSDQEGSALLLLLALADYADENGFAFPGQETLATKARLCVRQTRRLLADLQAAGELLILDRPGRSNLYVVLAGASRQALAAALERAARFGARTDTSPTPDIPAAATVMSTTPDIAMSASPATVMSMTPDIVVSGVPNTVMSTTPDIAMSSLPAPTPDISGTTPDISAPTPDIAVSAPPDIAMSSDPSLPIKDPSEDPSEDPSGEFSWRKILDALSLKMDPATFNLWLRGSRALSLCDGCLTVQAGHANALPWLEHRLSRIIERVLAYTLPGVRVRFLAPGDSHQPVACGSMAQAPARAAEASRPAPEAPAPAAPPSGTLPEAPGPRSGVPAPTPSPVHLPPATLHRALSILYPSSSLIPSPLSLSPFPSPPSPPGEGSIIVSQKKICIDPSPALPLLPAGCRLPLAAAGGLARERPERGRHRPPRGPPRPLGP